MASTFFGLTIASSGLRAANAALNTTGNNISNVQTEGYSRQQVETEAANALRVFATYGCAGAGVETLAVERVRDAFYDNKYWSNETKLGEYDAKLYYCNMIQEYLKDDNVTGFKTLFNGVSAALQEITKNASSTDTKSQFLGTLKSLTDYFNNLYGDLQDLQSDVNDEIKIRADQINSIAQDLATINKQINVVELTGKRANELRDKRDSLIDELSAVVDVQTYEYPILDEQGYETAAHRYMVKIAGGQTLVDMDSYRTLICVSRTDEEKVNQSDVDGLYDLMWSNGVEFSLYNASMGGELKGLIEMRDGNNGEYFKGQVSNVTYHDTFSTVTVKTDALHLQSISKCTLSDTGGIINVGDQLFYYTKWTYNGDGEYTFTVDNKKSDLPLTPAKSWSEASVGGAINYQGVPYYMEQMNEWVREFAKKVNDIFKVGLTGEDPPQKADIVFTANYKRKDGQYTQAELDKATPTPKEENTGYYNLTAGNITLLDALVKNPNLLGTRKDVDDTAGYGDQTDGQDDLEGQEQCEQVWAVISMLGDVNQFSFRGRDAGGFLECVLSDATLNTSNAETLYATYYSLETNIDNQRISISGVDEDEEAMNLVKYENSYTLASKMINVLTEIYDRLILQTGV
ncbi:MAG: flagellar hook-associated protein FlgK [Bacteroidales bacterium]|nr:flagellar hook-associated protein FlgK [Bacteroidales bacterium]MCM1415882.1 flagellar hook-associated protein FlgK [bacterium]MCM1422688.1 flagellar hook-associated protein FlgK [bacterium]